MRDPRQISPGSTMPAYPWLFSKEADLSVLPNRIAVLKKLGVPYPEQSDAEILADAKAEAERIAADLGTAGAPINPNREIVALIAYLQRMGKSNARPLAEAPTAAPATK
jgi:cytochrome c oxidase cbb3-type subunit I/II